MYPINDRRILKVIIQRQFEDNSMIEMEFKGLRYLQLLPCNDKYTCEILDSSMILKNGYIYWCDCGGVLETDLDNYAGTMICEMCIRDRGTPVLKQDISGGSMSLCNTIFLSRREWDSEIVKHEWGHTVQQSLMGTPKFIMRMGIPSLIGAGLDVDAYFSQPWERSADFFGGANNGPYREGSDLLAAFYFLIP